MNFEIKIEVEIVDEIERTPTGKFKWIVSNISRQRKIFPE
jgi:hypothetical protein